MDDLEALLAMTPREPAPDPRELEQREIEMRTLRALARPEAAESPPVVDDHNRWDTPPRPPSPKPRPTSDEMLRSAAAQPGRPGPVMPVRR